MRYSLSLALGPMALLLLLLLALALILTEQRASIAHAAPSVNARHVLTRGGVEHKEAAVAAAAAQTHRADAGATPAIREVDLEGLKKLLQRDGATSGKNARPLLVNFWATWCGPCRDEFPDLVRINADYSGRNLDFITVSLDDPSEIKTTVPAFLREMRAPMPSYLLNVIDPETVISAVDPSWGGGLPATFLYDANGRLVFKHTGRIKAEELRAAIDKVTSGK
ncbi:MAG TPA: redoxin domain-containing protein [Pyrinomonadaceae bacterium]|jgi:thiol-disulfide isomerase/thioredoxin|nr:redoxin domain-containing protein [Pyrinomonadaceae bacterium]